MLIEDGELLTGIICKKAVGTSGNSLVHIIAVEKGPEVAKEFYGDIQKVTNNFFLVEGFSIGKGIIVFADFLSFIYILTKLLSSAAE